MTPYKKALLVIVAALPLGSALAATATPASARDAGPVIAGALGGFAAGAIIGSTMGHLLSRLFKWRLRRSLSRRILCPGLHPQLLFGAARHL